MMDVLEVFDLDDKTMTEFARGRRKALMIYLKEPPFIDLKVILYAARTEPPQPGPQELNGRVIGIINLSCFISTPHYYTLNLEIQP